MDEACKRDEERLAGLQRGGTLGRDELVRFERELGCERLRPLVLAAISAPALETPKTRLVPAPELMDTPQLVRAAQAQLRRIGCFAGDDDGKLNDATRSAVKRYLTQRGLPANEIKISESLVAELKTQDKGVCALDCKRGQIEKNGRCVVVEKVAEPRRTKKAKPEPRQRTAAPAPRRTFQGAPINDSSPAAAPTVTPSIGLGGFGGRFGIRIGR